MTPRIIALCGPAAGSVFPIESDLNIGRGKSNHVRLNDPHLALQHCGICYEYGHCLIFAKENEQGGTKAQ